jgi:hypothetical protein
MNHQHQVLMHLKQGKTISQGEAIDLFNCWRLSAVIHRLRRDGFDIISHTEPNIHSKGNHTRYELKGVTA